MTRHLFKLKIILIAGLAVIFLAADTHGDSYQKERAASLHAGFLYHNGVDLVGYTVEHKLKNRLYGYYTFGIPCLAAAGISYYSDYHHNGFAATLGVGIGSVMYSSLVYQIRIADQHFIKLGAGYTTGIAYTGIYPALSYEIRLK